MPLSKLDFKHIELVELAIFREITSFSIALINFNPMPLFGPMLYLLFQNSLAYAVIQDYATIWILRVLRKSFTAQHLCLCI